MVNRKGYYKGGGQKKGGERVQKDFERATIKINNMANQREHSKQNWASRGSTEDINSGSLQRIADACEIMAQNYVALQNRVKCLEESNELHWQERHKKDRQISALKGVITKLKKQHQG